MIIRMLIFFMAYVVLTDGACLFHTNDTNDRQLQQNMMKWKIYEHNYTVSSGATTYQIGICSELNNTGKSAAIFQKENNTFYALGQLSRVNLVGTDNWMLLTYENGTRYDNVCDNKTRSASIMFVCGQNSSNITILQEHSSKNEHCNYMFQFQVPEMCSIVPTEKKKMSGGAIFLIILGCLASIYLIGGFLFMRLQRGARGIDQIPNLDMWRKLGHLSADGCDFCCRCNTNSARAGYFIDGSGPDLRGDDDILSP